ncbi:YHS domain-containing protein [Candidatus Peregrinibacteria bacterium]|nr:MAG: YHS domain-containing protein [Candidatus Peregrinibacteria bacterium]
MENSSCCSPKNSSPVKDVVCGMELTPTEDTLQVAHKGCIYYFCSTACNDQFVTDPEKYLSTAAN